MQVDVTVASGRGNRTKHRRRRLELKIGVLLEHSHAAHGVLLQQQLLLLLAHDVRIVVHHALRAPARQATPRRIVCLLARVLVVVVVVVHLHLLLHLLQLRGQRFCTTKAIDHDSLEVHWLLRVRLHMVLLWWYAIVVRQVLGVLRKRAERQRSLADTDRGGIRA